MRKPLVSLTSYDEEAAGRKIFLRREEKLVGTIARVALGGRCLGGGCVELEEGGFIHSGPNRVFWEKYDMVDPYIHSETLQIEEGLAKAIAASLLSNEDLSLKKDSRTKQTLTLSNKLNPVCTISLKEREIIFSPPYETTSQTEEDLGLRPIVDYLLEQKEVHHSLPCRTNPSRRT